jgi:hypothetical protein
LKPKVSFEEFANELVNTAGISELEICLAISWYIGLIDELKSVSLVRVIEAIEQFGVRHGINRSRLSSNIIKSRVASLRNGEVSLTLLQRNAFAAKYSSFFEPRAVQIEDSILQLNDFIHARNYVREIAKQVNGSHQFLFFDACAVMMRRLAEVLIIDAYEAKGLRDKILEKNNYMMLSGLVGCLLSGIDFKLSRNAPKWLDRLKELGDNAAHSRTYITKSLDIDDFKGSFRNLISELIAL